MKKIKLILGMVFCVGLFNFSMAQNKEVQNSNLYKHYQMKYVFGMKYNDTEIAKSAIYSMISLDPTDDSLKFNLCYMYFDEGQFASSLFVASDILSRNARSREALEVAAISYERMGLRDKAVDTYESLYMIDNSPNILYQMAALQFELKRFKECKNNLNILAQRPKAKEIKVNMPKSERENQQVTLEAAAYNLLGLVEKEQGNKAEARKHFQKAIEIDPEFAMAKENVAELGN